MSRVPPFFGPRTTVYGPFTTADELLEPPFHHGYYPPTVVTETSTFATHVDWSETPHAYVLKIHLPGLKKEDVNMEVEEDRVLKISGERNEEFEDRNGRWHRVERRSGMFLKRVQLPENAKVEQLKAKMVNGELTITVPKSEAKRTHRRFVEIFD